MAVSLLSGNRPTDILVLQTIFITIIFWSPIDTIALSLLVDILVELGE